MDTAGIRKFAGTNDSREKAGIIRAKANIRDADVICLVLDVREFPTRQDAHIAQLAHESGKPLILVLNKWDLVDTNAVDPEVFREAVFRKLSFVELRPAPLHLGRDRAIASSRSWILAEKVYGSATRHVETSKLNAFLARAAEAHPPRLRSGARAKLRYMTQKGVLPPTFILFQGAGGPLSPTYEKHFLEMLREAFGFDGTPLRLFVRTS